MYAVIKTGGKQYRVTEGQKLRVEKLPGNAGDALEFDEVLMVGGDAPKFGQPLVSGASVSAEILGQAGLVQHPSTSYVVAPGAPTIHVLVPSSASKVHRLVSLCEIQRGDRLHPRDRFFNGLRRWRPAARHAPQPTAAASAPRSAAAPTDPSPARIQAAR